MFLLHGLMLVSLPSLPCLSKQWPWQRPRCCTHNSSWFGIRSRAPPCHPQTLPRSPGNGTIKKRGACCQAKQDYPGMPSIPGVGHTMHAPKRQRDNSCCEAKDTFGRSSDGLLIGEPSARVEKHCITAALSAARSSSQTNTRKDLPAARCHGSMRWTRTALVLPPMVA